LRIIPGIKGRFIPHKECQESKEYHILIINPHIHVPKKLNLIVWNILHLHHIANNLSKAFTDNKGVTKFSYPAHNALERMEVPIKNHSTPTSKEEGEKYGCS
jgi:hypothetical protein